MNLYHVAALALLLSLLAASSCSNQSPKQEIPRQEPIAALPEQPHAKVGTVTCDSCTISTWFDQAPGCYTGFVPAMKSYEAVKSGYPMTGDSSKEKGPPFPEVKVGLCIKSKDSGINLDSVTVTTNSPDWNSFFDDNQLHLSAEDPGFDVWAEGYLRGVATWAMLTWRCETTIPDHKRLLCEHSWSRETGPTASGPAFSGQSEQKVMYYLVGN